MDQKTKRILWSGLAGLVLGGPVVALTAAAIAAKRYDEDGRIIDDDGPDYRQAQ